MRDWKIERAKKKILKIILTTQKFGKNVSYRPFDIRKTFTQANKMDLFARRYKIMRHYLKKI